MKRIWSFSDNATTDIVLNSEALSLTCWLTSADFSVVFLFCFFFGRTSRLKSLITCVCSRISWTRLRPWPNPALLFKSDKPWCHPAVLAEVTALCGKCQLDMKSADFTGGKKIQLSAEGSTSGEDKKWFLGRSVCGSERINGIVPVRTNPVTKRRILFRKCVCKVVLIIRIFVLWGWRWKCSFRIKEVIFHSCTLHGGTSLRGRNPGGSTWGGIGLGGTISSSGTWIAQVLDVGYTNIGLGFPVWTQVLVCDLSLIDSYYPGLSSRNLHRPLPQSHPASPRAWPQFVSRLPLWPLWSTACIFNIFLRLSLKKLDIIWFLSGTGGRDWASATSLNPISDLVHWAHLIFPSHSAPRLTLYSPPTSPQPFLLGWTSCPPSILLLLFSGLWFVSSF